ncbi:MAG: GH36-type glycosyl hydrolase domain-containing protein, partial [Polyangiales bacterium]
LAASRGSLARQLHRATTDGFARSASIEPTRAPAPILPVASPRPRLHFDNGVGGFSEDGREYVLLLGPGVRAPAPWSNVIANPRFGTLVSETGASFTWCGNSQRHRLTPWSNDPISDPSGEALYIRDEDDGEVWSPTPMPTGGTASYEVHHGQGYTRFQHRRGDLSHVLTMLVSPKDPVKIFRLRITNVGARTRRLSLFGVVEWVLGGSREHTRRSVVTERDDRSNAVFAFNPLGVFPERVAFFGATRPIVGVTGDREEFFGEAGSRAQPAAVGRVALSGRTGPGLDPCGAIQIQLSIGPGESVEVALILGEGDGVEHARSLLRAYATDAAVASTESAVVTHWNTLLGAVTVRTPDLALDLLMNRWLLYQVASCRLWGRSAFYQSGGAFGFRDQLQDVLALIHARPDLAREHIVRSAARQFQEGDVQHWWHPESGEGVRTRCSDDLLWLPFATNEYVRATGDTEILNETLPFLKERALTPTDEDIFGTPQLSSESATLYEHCVRALDRGATRGPHGLPLMGSGDWNDGMTLVGRGGVGESIWLAWFLAKVARDFEPNAARRGDDVRVGWCRDQRVHLAAAIHEHGWDGGWYRRAYFDDGSPMGSSESAECRIDSIAQSWALIAGIGDPARAREALDSSVKQLLRADAGLMALLSPPFDRSGRNPGYLGAYPPGIRENGGQYTHGALWTVQALAIAGEGDRAGRLLSRLNPIHHTASREAAELYKLEPYVVAADIYTAPGHVGRGGWSWYTGSASVMYRVALENLLGLRRSGSHLTIDPRIPRAWPGFEITYRHGEDELHISVQNPAGVERGVVRVEVDGHHHEDGKIPVVAAKGRRAARVVMG